MQRSILSFALVGVVGLATALAEDKAAPKSDPAAEAMMHKAHVARSAWGRDFPGFQAQISVAIDGDRVDGTVVISKSGEVSLSLPDGPALKWAREQFESIAMHRTAEVRDKYDVSFADDVLHHPLGRLIKFHGGTTHSVYRIRDDVITEVHRTMDKVRFTISVTDVTRNSEGETLPRHFNVSYWDTASGVLQSNHDFTDDWVHLGKHDLPKSRLLVKTGKEGRQVFEFRLTGHELAGTAAAK